MSTLTRSRIKIDPDAEADLSRLAAPTSARNSTPLRTPSRGRHHRSRSWNSSANDTLTPRHGLAGHASVRLSESNDHSVSVNSAEINCGGCVRDENDAYADTISRTRPRRGSTSERLGGGDGRIQASGSEVLGSTRQEEMLLRGADNFQHSDRHVSLQKVEYTTTHV